MDVNKKKYEKCLHVHFREIWRYVCTINNLFFMTYQHEATQDRVKIWRMCIALHFIALHCIALHCISLRCIEQRKQSLSFTLYPSWRYEETSWVRGWYRPLYLHYFIHNLKYLTTPCTTHISLYSMCNLHLTTPCATYIWRLIRCFILTPRDFVRYSIFSFKIDISSKLNVVSRAPIPRVSTLLCREKIH